MRGGSSAIMRVHSGLRRAGVRHPHAKSSLRTDTGAKGPNQQVRRTPTLYIIEDATRVAAGCE